MKNKILVTDILTKVDIDENPNATNVVTKECDIALYNDDRLNDFFIKKNKNSALIPLNEEQNQILVKSNLYKNRYYTLKNYNELYVDDLSRIIQAFALRMGAKEYKVSYYEKEEEFNETNFSIDQNAGVSVSKDVKINQGVSGAIDKSSTKENIRKIEEKHEELEPNKVSKEELGKWIQSENLDVDALPGFFSEYIKRYLECGKVSGNITKTEELSNSLKQNAHYQAKLNASLDLPKFLSANLDLKTEYASSKRYKFTKIVEYMIKF